MSPAHGLPAQSCQCLSMHEFGRLKNDLYSFSLFTRYFVCLQALKIFLFCKMPVYELIFKRNLQIVETVSLCLPHDCDLSLLAVCVLTLTAVGLLQSSFTFYVLTATFKNMLNGFLLL